MFNRGLGIVMWKSAFLGIIYGIILAGIIMYTFWYLATGIIPLVLN